MNIIITGLVKNHLKRCLSSLSQLLFSNLNSSFEFSLKASARIPNVRQINRKTEYIIFCAVCGILPGIKSNITETKLFVACTAIAKSSEMCIRDRFYLL